MEGGENGMSGQGRIDGRNGGGGVADFPDHDGILTLAV
jgi:hypothetical protein